MMKSKKAWIRIVEATVGVLLVASVLFVMVARAPKTSEKNIYETQHFILEQISKNDQLRGLIVNYDTSVIPQPDPPINEVDLFIRGMMPAYLDFKFRVCEVNAACGMLYYPGNKEKEIYSDEILITSTLQQYSPKKVRLFVWER